MQKDLLKQINNQSSINEIQEYIKRVIEIRGFSHQPIEQSLLLLCEEVGELAKAIRKEQTNMAIDNDKIKNYDTVESEIADVFIVLTSICNHLNINLLDAFKRKEETNITRVWSNTNRK